MRYEKIEAAVFKSRPNRFIAHVETERGSEVCHVKNTGRCKELLMPETRYGDSRIDLYLEDGDVRMFLEIKGVTLEEDGVACFPDAPTERAGVHIMAVACLVEPDSICADEEVEVRL